MLSYKKLVFGVLAVSAIAAAVFVNKSKCSISYNPKTIAGAGQEFAQCASYSQSLTAEELKMTEEVAKDYFTKEAPYYEGIASIHTAPDDYWLYHNEGIEVNYQPGNIIIYIVLTEKDKKEENPERFISIAREAENSEWKIINQGY